MATIATITISNKNDFICGDLNLRTILPLEFSKLIILLGEKMLSKIKKK